MGCVQCKDKEAAKLTDDRETSLSHNSGYRYGSDPTPQHYPSFGVTTIPNYNNFHSGATQGVTVFGGVHTSSQSGTLRSRGGTGEVEKLFLINLWVHVRVFLASIQHILKPFHATHVFIHI